MIEKRLLKILLVSIIFICFSCERNRSQIGDSQVHNEKSVSETQKYVSESKEKPLTIKLYIENSGSMSGYVNGMTELKDVLHNLLVDLKYYYKEENIEINFINSQVIDNPIKTSVVNFASQLTPNSIKIGNTSSSNLNLVYRQILEKSDDNSISILFSDCIYSIKGQNTPQLLDDQKALSKDVFLSAGAGGKKITTNFYQFTSQFNGFYYDMNDQPIQLDSKRPYYINIIGEQKPITEFSKNLGKKITKYKGYSNEYLMSLSDYRVKNYTILTSTLNSNIIKPLRGNSESELVKAIEKPDVERNSKNLVFALALNLKELNVGEDYLLKTENYTVADKIFRVKKIGKIENDEIKFGNTEVVKLNPIDLKRVSNGMTHVVVFESMKPNFKSLEFSLKRNTPDWVVKSTSLDDTQIAIDQTEQNKTFGLSYLIDGITDAYVMQTNEKELFKITIPIENKKSNSYGFWILGAIVVLGLLSLIIKKLNK